MQNRKTKRKTKALLVEILQVKFNNVFGDIYYLLSRREYGRTAVKKEAFAESAMIHSKRREI